MSLASKSKTLSISELVNIIKELNSIKARFDKLSNEIKELRSIQQVLVSEYDIILGEHLSDMQHGHEQVLRHLKELIGGKVLDSSAEFNEDLANIIIDDNDDLPF